ncbi:AraC family transcriptional regulator [Paraburkholderia edwinii]|uniref:AraC family transcriptional regulator n=1 Tax=Paraburkholderia edwinii TaxID=2861782 RepID=A0ABX8UEG0_9BURK|nr:AraC family transcriptional regulator [Paraburkholderia edwinii]QYD67123.1 AraC family transcriptional regulator [Paraburkholderia edwinii]
MTRLPRISTTDLDSLLTRLDVKFVDLAECHVSPGWRLSFAPSKKPALHYNLDGTGELVVGDNAPIRLSPHMLIVVPAERPFHITAFDHDNRVPMQKMVDLEACEQSGSLVRFVAGTEKPEVILVCGYFQATYGTTIELFSGLTSPIVERFDVEDRLDQTLKSVIDELAKQQVGVSAMTTTLLKQVLVMLLRRSLTSTSVLSERFSMLSDPQIARAFSEMVNRPGAPHSIRSLAQLSGLNRSSFMQRFADLVGESPIAVLRQLRMRQAAATLASNRELSIDQIARNVGYASRSSFLRAFRKVYGMDPSEYVDIERP